MTNSPRRGPWTISNLMPLALCGLVALPVFAQGSSAAPIPSMVPVVVAVDTSRSLSSAELGRIVERLHAVVAALPEGTPSALLAFDDEPRWLRRLGASPADVGVGLEELKLSGNFTLLNDALFVAVRELTEGGVILLATDGRDENSATTVEDIARRCEAQSVRIVALGAGRQVQERSLRRLALVSNGAYLGEINRAEEGTVVAAVEKVREEVRQERAVVAESKPSVREVAPSPATPAVAETGVTPSSVAASGQGSATATGSRGWTRIVGSASLAGVMVAALLWWLLKRSRRPTYCQECGTELEPGETDCEQCRVLGLRRELVSRDVASLAEAPEVTVDTAVFHQMNLDEKLEKTRVLSNQSVLLVRKPGEAPRSFLLGLGEGQAFAIGRERDGNTLAVPDPSLSAHHFKIVPEGDRFYFVDLGSTNGSFVNGVRSSIHELKSGDVIHAGQVEFEYQSHADF